MGKIWQIQPEAMQGYLRQLKSLQLSASELSDRVEASGNRAIGSTSGSIAVIPIMGPITYRASVFSAFFGGTTTMQVSRAIDAALADDSVSTIVLDVDSPGGESYGLPELATKIREGREKKRIIAIANPFAASAAYHIISGATEIVSIPSGDVGSIGVYWMHEDISEALAKKGVKLTFIYAGEFKVEGNPFEPLDDAAKVQIQSEIDATYQQFLKSIALGRGLSVQTVKADFGSGRMLSATAAKKVGMIDRIATLEDVVGRIARGRQTANRYSKKLSILKAGMEQ